MRVRGACAVLVTALLTASPALAQQCGPRDLVEEALASEYKEQPIGQGLSGRGAVFKLYANPETGSWTAIVALPNGGACIVDGGEEWEIIAPVLGRPS